MANEMHGSGTKIADLKPYTEYKESGLPWLGQVPQHGWVRRMKSADILAIEKEAEGLLDGLLKGGTTS